jgi:hypothetical protein
MKFDNGKPPLALIPSEALIEIAEVLGFGAEKYGPNNWREDADKTKWSRSYSSLQRHLNAFKSLSTCCYTNRYLNGTKV